MSKILTTEDLHSATWLKLRAHYTAELAKQRARNDGKLSVEDTAKLRGRIATIKELLALEHPDPVPVLSSAP